MKEIIAIIRPKKVNATRNALEQIGFPSMTAIAVIGRGLQRGIAGEINIECPPNLLVPNNKGGMRYIPKRLLSIVAQDSDVEKIVRTIINVNQTAQIGDGKIFICPLDNAIRVRTSEEGESAVL